MASEAQPVAPPGALGMLWQIFSDVFTSTFGVFGVWPPVVLLVGVLGLLAWSFLQGARSAHRFSFDEESG